MFRSGIPLILLLILLVQGKSFSSVVSATSGETHKLKFHLRSERSIVSKEQLLQTRNFFQLFNIPCKFPLPNPCQYIFIAKIINSLLYCFQISSASLRPQANGHSFRPYFKSKSIRSAVRYLFKTMNI